MTKIVKESLRDKLKGPTEEEALDKLIAKKNGEIRNIFIESVRKGFLRGVKYAAKQGYDIHAQDDWALEISAREGHLNIVKYLIEQGANARSYHNDAIEMAVENGHLDIVKYMVNHGDVNVLVGDGIIIDIAKDYGHQDIVDYLEDKVREENENFLQ